MNKQLTPEDLVLELEEDQLTELEQYENSKHAIEHESPSLEDSDILRVEEKISFHWSGVKGCNRRERVERELNKDFQNWVKGKLYEYRDLRWIKYGIVSGSVKGKCSKWKDRWTGKRKCVCRGGMKGYIEFRKI